MEVRGSVFLGPHLEVVWHLTPTQTLTCWYVTSLLVVSEFSGTVCNWNTQRAVTQLYSASSVTLTLPITATPQLNTINALLKSISNKNYLKKFQRCFLDYMYLGFLPFCKMLEQYFMQSTFLHTFELKSHTHTLYHADWILITPIRLMPEKLSMLRHTGIISSLQQVYLELSSMHSTANSTST